MKERGIRTAILISGAGTTMEAVVKACRSGELPNIDPVLVISSRRDVGGIRNAQALGVPVRVERRINGTNGEFGDRLHGALKASRVELVVQLGWTPLTPGVVVEAYRGRIINQHPAPLDNGRPDFGGQGMRGLAAQCAVVLYNWMTGAPLPTESTTHHVDVEYDKGNIIRRVPMDVPQYGRVVASQEVIEDPRVRENLVDAVHTTQAQLFPIEYDNVVHTLNFFRPGFNGGVPIYEREKPLIPYGKSPVLEEAKKLAVQIFPKG